MPAIVVGGATLYGISEPLPPKGFPEGKLRWRIRSDDFTIAIVKTAERTRAFIVKEEDGHWVPSFETDVPGFGTSAGGQIKALRDTLNRYRVLLFGKDYQNDDISAIRALAAHEDMHVMDAFANSEPQFCKNNVFKDLQLEDEMMALAHGNKLPDSPSPNALIVEMKLIRMGKVINQAHRALDTLGVARQAGKGMALVNRINELAAHKQS